MATTTLDDTINRQTYGLLGTLLTKQTFWVFVAAVIAFIYLSFATTAFFAPGNLFNVFRNFAFVGIMGLGMTAVIITGGIDLSVGSVLCLSGMVAGMSMAAGYSMWLAIPAGMLAALAVGGASGILIAYIGMAPFVVTLGMMSLARSLAMVMSNNTMVFQFGPDHKKFIALGGGSTKDWFVALANWVGPDTDLGGFATTLGNVINIPNPAVVLGVLALAFGFAFRWTRWGRYIFAIGGNEHAATLTGVPVRRIKVSVYLLSALDGGDRRRPPGRLARNDHHRDGHRHGAGGHRRRRHRRRQPDGRQRHRLRRGGRRGADRGHPQQLEHARDQPLLAGDIRRHLHHSRRPLRPHPGLPPEPLVGIATGSKVPLFVAESSRGAARYRTAGEVRMVQFANITEGLRFRVVLRPGVAIGPGKADLLEAIGDTSSLTAAAARFGMSYKRSWNLVREMNAAFASPLVETEKGGSGGGGSARLTALGRHVLRRYRKMEADATRAIDAGVRDLRQHLAPQKRTRKTPA